MATASPRGVRTQLISGTLLGVALIAATLVMVWRFRGVGHFSTSKGASKPKLPCSRPMSLTPMIRVLLTVWLFFKSKRKSGRKLFGMQRG